MEKSEVEQITVLHRALGQKRRQRYAIPYVVYLQSDGGFTYGCNWEDEHGATGVPNRKLGYSTKKKAIEAAISHFETGEYALPY